MTVVFVNLGLTLLEVVIIVLAARMVKFLQAVLLLVPGVNLAVFRETLFVFHVKLVRLQASGQRRAKLVMEQENIQEVVQPFARLLL